MTVVKAHLDFETGSACDLKKAGTVRYSQHHTTRVWGFCYRIGSGLVQRWMPGYSEPEDLLEFIRNGGIVVAHKADFERHVWNNVMRGKYGYSHWPELTPHQQECTMARSYAMNLPGSLEKVAEILGVENQKDMEGSAAMKRLMKPRKVNIDGSLTWWSEGDEGAALVERNMVYCANDVLAECDVDEKVPSLSDYEQQVWIFDQVINDRGVKFDVPASERAAELTAHAKKRADRQMRSITNGGVRKVSEVGKLVDWINSEGVPCDAVKKGTFKELVFNASMAENQAVQDAVELRRDTSKTSTAKYPKILECVNDDDRIRMMLQYHGAGTGRWAGRMVQPQNFPRFDDENPAEAEAVAYLVQGLNDNDIPITELYEIMEMTYGRTLHWLSKALRSMMLADDGMIFRGGDFSNIEGRANAWLAGEDWKIDAFLAYDNKTGPDLYKLSYANSFAVSVEDVTKALRQIGKVQELASGYQGGVGAYISMAEKYTLEVFDLATTTYENVDPLVWLEVEEKYKSATDKHGLRAFEWTALKLLVNGWRSAHPMIVQSWWDYQDAAIAAIDNPGDIYDVADMSTKGNQPIGKVRYMSDGNYLYCCLPSGRVISYAQPWLEQVELKRDRADGTQYTTWQTKIRFMGVDSYTKKWGQQSLYGGLLCENVVQATARDVMVESMFRVEQAGYPIILTVHDEILSETFPTHGSVDEFRELMAVLPAWATGLPLAVDAWEDKRYVK